MTDPTVSARARLRMGVGRMVEEREAQILLKIIELDMLAYRARLSLIDELPDSDGIVTVNRDRAAVLAAFLGERADG